MKYRLRAAVWARARAQKSWRQLGAESARSGEATASRNSWRRGCSQGDEPADRTLGSLNEIRRFGRPPDLLLERGGVAVIANRKFTF